MPAPTPGEPFRLKFAIQWKLRLKRRRKNEGRERRRHRRLGRRPGEATSSPPLYPSPNLHNNGAPNRNSASEPDHGRLEREHPWILGGPAHQRSAREPPATVSLFGAARPPN